MLYFRDNYTKNADLNPDLSLLCRKITPLFISEKLDLDILIFYTLVLCMTLKDKIGLNEIPTQPK